MRWRAGVLLGVCWALAGAAPHKKPGARVPWEDGARKHVEPWRRVRGVAHPPYRCRNLSAAAAPRRACLRQAHERIEAMQRRRLWAYPVSFCVPRSEAVWYHNQFWNFTKTVAVGEGIHSTSQKDGSTRRWVRTWGISDEEAYLRMYARAKVVRTKRKGGWDCLRHLEILLAGALYRFDDTAGLDALTLFHYPKECTAEMGGAASLPHTQYLQLRNDVWEFTLTHLTCDAMASFMMQALDFDPCAPGPVLFLDAKLPDVMDFQSVSTLIGLRDVLGPNLHVWREPLWAYADWTGDHRQLYGNGMVYSMAMDPALKTGGVPDDEVVRRLRSQYYRLVVYGSAIRSTPFWEEVTAALPPDRVWAVVGEDPPAGWEEFFTQGQSLHATAFVREMLTENFCPVPRPKSHGMVETSSTCVAAAAEALPPLPPGAEFECLRRAEARIQALDVSRRVYPVSLSLPAAWLASGGDLASWRPPNASVDPQALGAEVDAGLGSLALLHSYATGTLPQWPASLPALPPLALFHHPKECFAAFRRLANASALRPGQALLHATRRFAQRHLTCVAMARFMLRTAGLDPCDDVPVLFLDDLLPTQPDPLSLTTLIGLRELLGPRLHVWREPRYLYQGQPVQAPPGCPDLLRHALNASLLQPDLPDVVVAKRLAAGVYKAVVFGGFHHCRTFLAKAKARLPPSRILAVAPHEPSLGPHRQGLPLTQFVLHLTDTYQPCNR